MKYAQFSADGLPTGFYSDDVHEIVPAGAISITESQWRYFLDNAGKAKWDGADAVPYTRQKLPAELEAEQSAAALRALEKIDRDSIRSIREYIAGKPDAPQALKNLEATAISERARVRTQ